MTDHPDFVDIARKITYDPMAPDNFHPKYLVVTDKGLGCMAPAYAHYLDIPIVGEYLAASCVIHCADLGEKVKLPPNMKRLWESKNLTEHEEVYLVQYRTPAATLGYIRQKKYPGCPTMLKVFKNWKMTCDKLVTVPHFGDSWRLPAFFPVYSAFCKAGIDEFFKEQKTLHPHLSSKMEEHRQHAMEQHYAWEDTFLLKASLHVVPFPRCLWYQKYHTIHELKRPDLWEGSFGDKDDHTIVVM